MADSRKVLLVGTGAQLVAAALSLAGPGAKHFENILDGSCDCGWASGHAPGCPARFEEPKVVMATIPSSDPT